MQHSQLEKLAEQLGTVWVASADAALQKALAEYAPFRDVAVDRAAYEAGVMPRLLRLLSLRMQSELQSLVLASMGAYLGLLALFATPPSELDRPASGWVHALPPALPALLSVSLVLREGGALDFEPPLAEVQRGLCDVLEALPRETGAVPALAARVFSRLELPDESLLSLDAQTNEHVIAARVELSRLLQALSSLSPRPAGGLRPQPHPRAPSGPPVASALDPSLTWAGRPVVEQASLQRPQQLLALFTSLFEELATLDIAEHLAAVQARSASSEPAATVFAATLRAPFTTAAVTTRHAGARLLARAVRGGDGQVAQHGRGGARVRAERGALPAAARALRGVAERARGQGQRARRGRGRARRRRAARALAPDLRRVPGDLRAAAGGERQRGGGDGDAGVR